jgi:N-methylhydantoinase A
MGNAGSKTAGSLSCIVGIDVGGTFTDIVLFDPVSGRLEVAKVPSTPANQALGVMTAIRTVESDLCRIGRVAHGTTVSTNALLQRAVARVALVTTAGFGDAIEIGRTRRMLPSQYEPSFVRPPPLVERPLRYEVTERLGATGVPLVALDTSGVEAIAASARAAGALSIAVCFLHSYANPVHERRVAEELARLAPDIAVTISAEVVPEFREYERFSTTIINASLMPVMGRYIAALDRALSEGGCRGELTTMSSSGGTMDAAMACKLPVRTILSGPAGGVAGSLWIARAIGLRKFVTCDMGGTSTDVCLVDDGQPSTTTEIAFAGYPIKGLQISINTVGAGGGSIAYVEAGTILRVGPRSAGADPGPACYGHGGREPTVTDANLCLGRVRESQPLGGHIRLDRKLAAQAIAALAEAVGIDDAARLAEGIVDIAVARMASAIREITVEKGHNPADFALLAFGGAGPMHAAQLAEELGMREVIIPMFPGNLSALGLIATDQRYEFVRTFLRPLGRLDPAEIEALLAAAEAQGRALLAERGFAADHMRFDHALDMRYARQAFEIPVAVVGDAIAREDLRTAFLATYERQYGHADTAAEIEIVNLRTTVIGVTAKPEPARAASTSIATPDALIARVPMTVRGVTADTGVYDRGRLPVGGSLAGPAIIEESGATTVLPPGWTASPDAFGNLRLEYVPHPA